MSSTIAAMSSSTPTTMSSAPATVPPAMDLPNAMSAPDAVFGVGADLDLVPCRTR